MCVQALRIGLRGVDCLSDFHEFERKFLIAANFVKQAYQLHSYDAQTELREIRPLIDRLKPMIVDCVSFWKALDLFTAIAKPNSMISDYDLDAERTLVIEGANAVMLDLGTKYLVVISLQISGHILIVRLRALMSAAPVLVSEFR